MKHGKHCDCMMCSMGKAVGMISTCRDASCTNPEHKKDKERKEQSK